MKKLILSVSLLVDEQGITLPQLEALITAQGTATVHLADEVHLADPPTHGDTRILYISGDDSDPYLQVPVMGSLDGTPLQDEEIEYLQKHGVCTHLYAEAPRFDRYGAPTYACFEDYAQGMISNHGFRVSSGAFSTRILDRGDDGVEQLWLEIVDPVCPREERPAPTHSAVWEEILTRAKVTIEHPKGLLDPETLAIRRHQADWLEELISNYAEELDTVEHEPILRTPQLITWVTKDLGTIQFLATPTLEAFIELANQSGLPLTFRVQAEHFCRQYKDLLNSLFSTVQTVTSST